LLAEDDQQLGYALKAGLEHEGFIVDWVRDGSAARYEASISSYSALVLDINMPLMNGIDVLINIRKSGNTTPVLILTAQDEVNTITETLDLGGDDYVVKPIEIVVLGARLRAIIRRSEGSSSNDLTLGSLRLSPQKYIVTLAGEAISLSKREFVLLHSLMISSGRVLTKEQIESQLYSWGHEIESNAIEVHIHNLRKKIGPNYIRTIRGVGYQIKDIS
jgi:two-component system OmpR family response regulator/two-component system response regulator QseB